MNRSSNSKKVLFVATVAKKHICQFHIPYLRWFHENGYEVHVCAGNDFEKNEKCEIAYCDRFYNISFSRSPFDFSNFSAYISMKKIILENDYVLIHCHTPIAAAVSRMAARYVYKNKKSVVLYTTHGFHFYKGAPLSGRFYYAAEKFLVRYTDGMITINSEDYNTAKKMCRKNKCDVYYVNGMGVDIQKFAHRNIDRAKLKCELGIPSDAFVLLSVSEINENKNLKTTISAFAKIKNKNICYLICGSGDMLEELKKFSMELNVDDRVIFLGYRYDIDNIVNIADIFLFPSLREGFGVAPIEAMSAGVPIIASDIRGVREYAVSMYNSILLSPYDINGYAEAIERLCEDDELRHRLSQNAVNSVEPFALEHSVKAMERIYSRYISINSDKTAVTV